MPSRAGVDAIYLTAAGSVSAAAFLTSPIEAVVLEGRTITSRCRSTGQPSGNGQFLATVGGNNTVDASAVTSTRTIIMLAGTGADTLKGGAGGDAFVFAPTDLTSADTVVGGAGNDSLWLRGGGTVAAASFVNVSGLEALVLSAAGNNVTLTNNLVGSGTFGSFYVLAQGGNNTVDGSGVTNNAPILFSGAGGNDTFKGGNGNDAFVFTAADLTSADTLQGGGGSDALFITSGGAMGARPSPASPVETLVPPAAISAS